MKVTILIIIALFISAIYSTQLRATMKCTPKYTVESGDTLSEIAKKMGVSASEIAKDNIKAKALSKA